MSDKIAEIRQRRGAIASAPWSYCGQKPVRDKFLGIDRGGNKPCQCGFIWSHAAGGFPVATVTRREWGDEYPDVRLIDGNVMGKSVEPFTNKIVYGFVEDFAADAHTRFIAHAPDDIDTLLAEIDRLNGEVGYLSKELKLAKRIIDMVSGDVIK